MSQRVPFQRICVQEAERLVASNDALVLDVRDADSFRAAHIHGALNVSIANLTSFVDGTAKNKPILIYCYHGYASQEYAQIFSDFGFSRVFSLDGGYEAWSNSLRSSSPAMLDPSLNQWLEANGFPTADVRAVVGNGTTPLMKASHQGCLDIVQALVKAGSELDARNADGNNALWLACVGEHPSVMDALIEAGINLDNRNDNGATPLMYAASTGKAAIVGRLLAAGADIAPETLDGFTALDMAATVECLTLLRAAAARSQANASASRPQVEQLGIGTPVP